MPRYNGNLDIKTDEEAYDRVTEEYDFDGASEIQRLLDALRTENTSLHEMICVLGGRLSPVTVDRSKTSDPSESAKAPLHSPMATALAQEVEKLASFRWTLRTLIESLEI